MNDTIRQARLQNDMKNPVVAIVLGFLIPGTGQMYAGSVMWGVINLVLMIVLTITVIGFPLACIIYIASIFLGYKGTTKFNDKILDNAEAEA